MHERCLLAVFKLKAGGELEKWQTVGGGGGGHETCEQPAITFDA